MSHYQVLGEVTIVGDDGAGRAVSGRMGAVLAMLLAAVPRANEALVVVGEAVGEGGRKLTAVTTIYTADGDRLATGEAV